MTKKLLIGALVAAIVIVAALFLLSKPATEQEITNEELPEELAQPETAEAGEQITIRDSQLQVNSVIARPNSLKDGEMLRILFSVKNAGIGDSAETKVNVYVDDKQINEMPLRVLLQGETTSMDASWTASGVGEHVAKVSVVSDDSAPADNEGIATFTVTA